MQPAWKSPIKKIDAFALRVTYPILHIHFYKTRVNNYWKMTSKVQHSFKDLCTIQDNEYESDFGYIYSVSGPGKSQNTRFFW